MFLDRRPTIPTIPMNSPRRMTGSVQLERHLLFHTTQATLCHHCTFCSRYFPLPIILFSLPILASLLHLPLLGSQHCMALWGTGCNVRPKVLGASVGKDGDPWCRFRRRCGGNGRNGIPWRYHGTGAGILLNHVLHRT